MPTVCGRAPIAPGSLTTTQVGTGLGAGRTWCWSRSTDQDAGEVDVRQYIL